MEKVVKESSKVVVADFWATWCKPCELMNPEMETLAEDMKDDIEVVTIDVEALKDVALKYEIQGIPTLICFKKRQRKRSHCRLQNGSCCRRLNSFYY